MEGNNKVILFQEKEIRRIWHKEEWYFSVIDVIQVLTDSTKPNRYWADMKKRSEKESNQPFAFCEQLKMLANDGKMRLTEVANTEGIFRIIMSIPSPKAEPFKLWFAQLGKERIDEIENPELAAERARELYRAKGYPEDWIETRMQSINVRNELTNEWKGRGVKEGPEYAILTAEISKATFGVTPSQHKEIKSLERQNLRDHMTNLELIFTMLGEEMTKQVAVQEDATGFDENKVAAQKGGKAAGNARLAAEQKSGVKVVSSHNFLTLEQKIEDKKLED
jgi:DNA-damage-inducible protein D